MRSRTTTARHGARQRSGDAPTSAAVGLSEETFERLYRDHVAPVFGYLARRVGPDLAEDLTAQTFVEAWAGRERFDPRKGAGVAWLFGIAVNQLRRHRRREAYQLTAFARTGVDPALPFDEAGVVHRVAAERSTRALAEALAGLSDVDRDVLTLAAWAGLSYAEISEVLDVPEGTVKSRLSRARSRLARRLAEELDPV